MSKKRNRYAWLQILTHVAAWLPLIWIAWRFFNDPLIINPVQDAEQKTGDTAIVLLILSLSITPLFTLTRFAPLINLRRPLGLYAFFYAMLHLTLFVGVDYGFDLNLIVKDVGDKAYILVGLAAILLLIPLAVTSIRWFVLRMGKAWKRLHRLVYVVGILVVLHFAWVVKGDVTRLQGDIVRPILAGVVVALLLIARIPPVRKRLAAIGQRFSPFQRRSARVVVRKKVGEEPS